MQQLGPSDVHVHARNHSGNRGTGAPPAPPLKLPVSRAEMPSKYMKILTFITSHAKCALTNQNGHGTPACVI